VTIRTRTVITARQADPEKTLRRKLRHRHARTRRPAPRGTAPLGRPRSTAARGGGGDGVRAQPPPPPHRPDDIWPFERYDTLVRPYVLSAEELYSDDVFGYHRIEVPA
jgi:hypothetical protein